MSQPSAHASPHLAEHFASIPHQRHSERMGMWLFLITEVLLFAGLFTCYAVYRVLFPDAFYEGSKHLDIVMGTVNTVVLLTSSLTVAFAVHFAREGKGKASAFFFLLSFLCAVAFLGIKAVEYKHHFDVGAYPGKYYAFKEVMVPGSAMFTTLYFFMTGLHGVHVVIGMGVLAWVALRAWKNEFNHEHFSAPEFAGMYWHLVDLVWIFLYPLLYLI